MKKTKTLILFLTILGLSFYGCSSSQDTVNTMQADAAQKSELQTLKSQLDAKDASLSQLKEEVGSIKKENDELKSASTMVSTSSVKGADELFPPNAKPGECYARVLIPATYETTTEKVLAKQASIKLEVIPAKLANGTERVLVKEASTQLVEVPATFEWVEERILVKPASKRLETVSAKYEWKEEKVLVNPASTVWKKGTGLIEKLDNSTGEVMCLVEVPAEYNTVRTKVLVSPESTRETEIPAEYQTVKIKKVKTPARTKEISIPAEYKTLNVRKEVSPATTRSIEIPAEYQTLTKRVKITEDRMEWRSVLCETNATPGLVTKIQQALLKAGHNPGPIDGVMGSATQSAIKSFQKANGLAIGGITQNTLKKLGI